MGDAFFFQQIGISLPYIPKIIRNFAVPKEKDKGEDETSKTTLQHALIWTKSN